MKVARAELYAQTLRAGRGAGISLGLAEELAEAAPWLSTKGVEAMARMLYEADSHGVLEQMAARLDRIQMGQNADSLAVPLTLMQAVAAGRGFGVEMGKRRLKPAAAIARAKPGPVQVSKEAWTCLTRLAKRTFVPATDASRASGAGAGADGD
ncbi:MAG: DUF3726 domain-containing protein [Pseudomonadota bacterium]